MLQYRTFFFDIEHISSIIKLRNRIFSISNRKSLKMLKTDQKENKHMQKKKIFLLIKYKRIFGSL